MWVLKKFEDLTLLELYEILKIRNEVFILEQHCFFLDIDGFDKDSYHLICFDGEKAIAYSRLIPKGVVYPDYCSIGRVCVSKQYRRDGLGIELVKRATNHALELFVDQPLKIGAQLYLKEFYQNLNFEQCSDEYLEDEILHIEMIYKA